MEKTVTRKPIGNFFIKRSLQVRLIMKILLAVMLSTLISSGSLVLVYILKYKTVIVYQLDKLSQDLSREHIIYLILPTLLISAVVNILVAIGIGMYSSRKYAVPIYKLEQWAHLLAQGKLGALLRFREKEEMKELSDECNLLSLNLRESFTEIKKQVEILKLQDPDSAPIATLNKVLEKIELETSPIEVNTTFYAVTNEGSVEKQPAM